jgi:hypothetical protein
VVLAVLVSQMAAISSLPSSLGLKSDLLTRVCSVQHMDWQALLARSSAALSQQM